MTENFTKEEQEYIAQMFKTLTFNLADCISLLKYCEIPDSKREILKDTLKLDLEYLMKLEDFIKDKLNKGE